MGFTLGMQGRFDEGLPLLLEGIDLGSDLGSDYSLGTAAAIGFLGRILRRQGKFDDARAYLQHCLSIQKELHDSLGHVWAFASLAEVEETVQSWVKALSYYEQSLDLRSVGRSYYESAALTGLVRVKHILGNHSDIPMLLAQAERLAQQYEYNDHLASLQLTQGHLAWENGNQDEAFVFFQKAMIYALRYNRFLLDELLSGRPQGTPLHPITQSCLERGEEGKNNLIALQDWWRTGLNDIGTPRPDTISPIPEGIPLLKAEKIARECESGDGSAQKSVIEQIEAAIGM